ncbi:MAG TPA: GGDEF domain-containing protein [Cellulomonas sp.]
MRGSAWTRAPPSDHPETNTDPATNIVDLDSELAGALPGAWERAVDELALLAESDARACVRRAGELIPLARMGGQRLAEMRMCYHAAVAHHALGEDSRALERAARAERLAEEHGELVWQSRALARQGMVHHDLGHVEDAVDLLTRAAELRREADDRAGTADVLTMLGTVYTAMPRFAPQAAGVLTQARRLWLAAGDPDRASIALAHLARTFVETSRRVADQNPRGARASARHALSLALEAVGEADAAGLSRTAIDARFTVATAHLLAGDAIAAGAVLDTAAAMLAGFPGGAQQLVLHRVRAQVLLAQDLDEAAAEETATGLRVAEETRRPAERQELLRVRVAALERVGDLDGALRALHELYDLTVRLTDAMAERRAMLLGARMEVEQAERQAESERRRSEALERRNARLAHEAAHDPLTALANRRELDREIAARAESGRPFAVALVDVDHFKRVNDTWSHQTGDEVLVRVAGTLRDALREDDLAVRWGGEEFALLLDGLDDRVAREVCERVRSAIGALTWTGPMAGEQVTVSIGVAAHAAGVPIEAVLAGADAALYEAKAGGRDQVRVGRALETAGAATDLAAHLADGLPADLAIGLSVDLAGAPGLAGTGDLGAATGSEPRPAPGR